MPIKLLIIGIGGVGKEHIRAAAILGIDDTVLMDIDTEVAAEFVKGLADGYVLNKWDTYEEKIPLPKGAVLVDNLASIGTPPTHVVIATPTETHEKVTIQVKAKFPQARILLEKPISEHETKVVVDYVGYNYDFKFKRGANILALCNSERQEDNGSIAFDLLSHLIAAALNNERRVVGLRVVSANSCVAFTAAGDVLVAMRNQTRHSVFFNGDAVDVDYAELFTNQLKRFLDGESNYEMALEAERIVQTGYRY